MSLDSLFGGGGDAEKAAEKAADAQVEAAKVSSKTIMKMFEMGRSDQAPWRISGTNALMAMSDMLGLQRPTMRQITDGEWTGGGTSNQVSQQGTQNVLSGVLLGPDGQPLPTMPAGNIGKDAIKGYQNIQNILKGMGGKPATYPTSTGQQYQVGGGTSGTDTKKKSQYNPYEESINMPKYEWKTSPGYDWRLSEGMKSINRSAAGQGSLLSGATMKALQRYGEGLASQEYGDVFNRLAGMAGTGQVTAAQSAQQAGQTGQAIGQNTLAAGNARASGYINAANARAQESQNMWKNLIGIGGIIANL